VERLRVAPGEQDREPRDESQDIERDVQQLDDDEVRDRQQQLDEDQPARQPLRIVDVERDRVRRPLLRLCD